MSRKPGVRGMGVWAVPPVRGVVCSCATIVGGSPRGILDLMRGRGRGSLGVADGTSYHSAGGVAWLGGPRGHGRSTSMLLVNV